LAELLPVPQFEKFPVCHSDDEDVKVSLYKEVLTSGKTPSLLYVLGNEGWPTDGALNLDKRLENVGFQVTSISYDSTEAKNIWNHPQNLA